MSILSNENRYMCVCGIGCSVIKSAIGKDMSKIPMPVQFNEPLSFLQVCAVLCCDVCEL